MLIGVLGFIGSGKGTVADILKEIRPSFEKASFADTVKDIASTIFNWPRHLLEGDTKESREFRETPDPFWTNKFGRPITPRAMLQIIGTEAGRNVIHENIWVFSLEARIRAKPDIIIPDTRFPNETDWIRSIGGFLVRVRRGPDPEWYDIAKEDNASGTDNMTKLYPNVHISEYAWVGQNMDYVLENDGSLEQLRASVKHMLAIFTGPVTV